MIPKINSSDVQKYLFNVKVNTCTVKNDIPAKLIRRFSKYLSEPFSHILNTQIKRGEYADIWKMENVTPVPKTYPVRLKKELRKIAIFLNFSKISEKIIADLVIEDMKKNLEKHQYGNQKGLSINHYLINMIHQILLALDNNTSQESKAVIASLYDWKSAFDKQCPKLGLESFMKNGVRPALLYPF